MLSRTPWWIERGVENPAKANSAREAISKSRRSRPILDLSTEELNEIYLQKRWSIRKIARETGISNPTIARILDRHSIVKRGHDEACIGAHKIPPSLKERLMEINRNSTPWWIKKGVENPSPRGPAHYLWKGGRFPSFGEHWWVQRRKALERDGYACRNCGVKLQELSTPNLLGVHHIKARSRGGTNELENLITLDTKCHRKADRSLIDVARWLTPEEFKPRAEEILRIVKG